MQQGKMRMRALIASILGALLVVVSALVLETERIGIEIKNWQAGDTPVTRFSRTDADGPVVVIAHGFAGSRQMMQGYALPLARAGYRVHVFDFLGHGRHTRPMSGDVTSVEGTTRLLMDQTADVIDAVAHGTSRVVLIGHSMATDILVRVAADNPDVGPLVLISAFSQEVTATAPRDTLFVTGAWEGRLRQFAVEAVQQVDPGATEGQTVRNGDVIRRAEIAPFTEHVSVLQSRAGRAATVIWLDRAYGRSSDVAIHPTGWAIMALFGGLGLFFIPLAHRLPRTQSHPPVPLRGRQFAALTLIPPIAAPLVSMPLDPGFLPVLVADYLALHLAIYGAIQLVLLHRFGRVWGDFAPLAFASLLIWSIAFGFALDRYAANFWPTAERLWIIAVLALGTLPFMLADARLAQGATRMRRVLQRAAFFASLALAVTLDFEGLFFVILIAPVIVLFYLVFGSTGRAVAQRSGPLVPGLVLGGVLAWALGVSFPLFQS